VRSFGKKIFSCCWRESASSLQFYCGCLPLGHIVDKRTIMFYRRLYRSDSSILHSLYCLRKPAVTGLTSKFGISSASASAHEIKHCMRKTLSLLVIIHLSVHNLSVPVYFWSYTVYLVLCSFYVDLYFARFYIFLHIAHCAAFWRYKRLID